MSATGSQAGQVVARLDRQNEENALRAARAAPDRGARAADRGAQQLPARSASCCRPASPPACATTRRRRRCAAPNPRWTPPRRRSNIAENRLGYTELVADAGGTVTARGAEPGEVVQPGRMIVQIARRGRPRRRLRRAAGAEGPGAGRAGDRGGADHGPAVRATGRVREVSPRADPVTGTFRVRVGLDDPPPTMRLGSTVTGRMEIGGGAGIEIPASRPDARAEPAGGLGGRPGDADRGAAHRRGPALRSRPACWSARGSSRGEIVVTAGVQALRPGQKVRLLGPQSAAR